MALYGCEAATVNEAALRGLQNAIKEVMGPKSPLAANNMVFTLLSNGTDLDPEVNILQRRLTMIRRMAIKRNDTRDKIYKLLKHYTNKQHIGTFHNDAQLPKLTPAPPPHHTSLHHITPSHTEPRHTHTTPLEHTTPHRTTLTPLHSRSHQSTRLVTSSSPHDMRQVCLLAQVCLNRDQLFRTRGKAGFTCIIDDAAYGDLESWLVSGEGGQGRHQDI